MPAQQCAGMFVFSMLPRFHAAMPRQRDYRITRAMHAGVLIPSAGSPAKFLGLCNEGMVLHAAGYFSGSGWRHHRKL
jgi:hypothetical protein